MRLSQFKAHTLKMLKMFEDKNKLKVVRAKPKVSATVTNAGCSFFVISFRTFCAFA
jgi:hypothetical protein